MTDQLPNNNQASPPAPANPLMQGPPPSPSSSPAAVLPDAPPPQDIAVDPVPLPSASPSNMVNPGSESVASPDINVETVVEPDPVKMPEAVVEQPVPEVPETTIAEPPAEVQEKPPDTGAPVPEEDPSAIRSPQPPVNQPPNSTQQHNKISKKVIAGITSLVFLAVTFASTLMVSQKVAYDPQLGYIGIKADNGCSNGLCPVISGQDENGKDIIAGYIKADAPVRGTFQDVQDARAGLAFDNLNVAKQAIQDAPTVKVEDNHVVRNEDTGRVQTTNGGEIPTMQEVQNALVAGNLSNTQNNVNTVVNNIIASASPTPAGGGSPSPTGIVSQGGDAGACYNLGDEKVERDCLANAKNGRYTSGACIGKTVEECSKLGKPTYCSGAQEKAGTVRAGEFLSCGGTSTNGCGQVDVYDNAGKLIGFVIDKSGCNGKPPEGETPGAPPRDIPSTPANPEATATPVTVSAKCDSLVGQTKDNTGAWVDRSDSEFVGLVRPGDQVRFVCTGHKTQGNFTKAAFFINNILHVDDVIKLSADKYAVPYTIPLSGVLTLKVEAVLLHDTEGWK